MIVSMKIKNVQKRGEVYFFRMQVPVDLVVDELTGHAPEGISKVALGYAGALPVSILKEGLDKLTWS